MHDSQEGQQVSSEHTASISDDWDLHDAETLTAAAVSGGGWRMLAVLSAALIQFGVSVVLARLLTPRDFGMVALVTVVLGVANMLAFLGFGPAVIQRRTLEHVHIQTAWTISIVSGLSAFGLIAAGATLLAQVVGESETGTLFLALSPSMILVGLRTVSLALLRRRLQFRQLAVIEVASYALGYAPVAIVGALAGWGVWCLVAALLGQGGVSTAGALWSERHSLKLGLNSRAARDLMGFAGGMTASGLTSYIALNGDYFLVGRLLGSTQLGFYMRAYYLMNLPLTYFAQVLSHVLLPSFSRLQQNRSRLAHAYLSSMYLAFTVSAPLMMLLLVAAPHIVNVLYGEQWVGAVAPLQVLALFGALRATYHLGGAVAQASGKPWSEFRRHLLYAVLVIIGCVVGSLWGVVGVAWGVGLAIGVMYVAMAHLCHRLTGFRWRAFFAAHRTGVVCGAAVAASGIALRSGLERLRWADWAVLLSLGLWCFGFGVIVAAALPKAWRPDTAQNVMRMAVSRVPGRVRNVMSKLARVDSAVG